MPIKCVVSGTPPGQTLTVYADDDNNGTFTQVLHNDQQRQLHLVRRGGRPIPGERQHDDRIGLGRLKVRLGQQ